MINSFLIVINQVFFFYYIDLVEELLLGEHECWLGVGHEDEDVAVQTESITKKHEDHETDQTNIKSFHVDTLKLCWYVIEPVLR